MNTKSAGNALFLRSILVMQDRFLKIRVLASLGTCFTGCSPSLEVNWTHLKQWWLMAHWSQHDLPWHHFFASVSWKCGWIWGSILCEFLHVTIIVRLKSLELSDTASVDLFRLLQPSAFFVAPALAFKPLVLGRMQSVTRMQHPQVSNSHKTSCSL